MLSGIVAAVLMAGALPAALLAWRSALASTPDVRGVVGGGLLAAGLALLSFGSVPLIASARLQAEIAAGRWSVVLARRSVLLLPVGLLLAASAAIAVG